MRINNNSFTVKKLHRVTKEILRVYSSIAKVRNQIKDVEAFIGSDKIISRTKGDLLRKQIRLNKYLGVLLDSENMIETDRISTVEIY